MWTLFVDHEPPHVQEAAQTSPVLLHEPAAANRRGGHRLLADPTAGWLTTGLRRRLALLAHWYAATGRLGARNDAALAIQVRLGHERLQLHLAAGDTTYKFLNS